MKWADAGFLGFDVETSGLDSARHRVIEIGLVWVRGDGEVEAYFSELCHWGDGAVDPGALAVNRILPQDLEGRPTFDERLPEVLGFACQAIEAGAIPLAYNAPFDTGFIRGAVRRTRSDYNPFDVNQCIDPLPFARSSGLQKNKLTDLCGRLGVPMSVAHRAGDDALAAVQVFRRLATDLCLPEHLEPLLLAQWAAVRVWEKHTGYRYS